MRKSRFGGFRRRWIRILGSRNDIREELMKTIFKFWKSIFRHQNSKSKSNFKFWGADFAFFRNCEVPISHFPETDFFKYRNFKFWQSRILHFHPISTQNFQFLGSIFRFVPRISLSTRNIFLIFLQLDSRALPQRGCCNSAIPILAVI